MKKIFLLIIMSYLASCNNDIFTKSDMFSKVERGMSPFEVVQLVGQPTDSVILGQGVDSVQIKVWYFNDTKAITFLNNSVDSVLDQKFMEDLAKEIKKDSKDNN